MKKITIRALLTPGFLFLVTCYPYAQRTGAAADRNLPDFIGNFFDSGYKANHPNELSIVEIRTKTMRHFLLNFKQAEEVHWFKTSNCIVAYFFMDGVKTRAAYNNNGCWLYNLRTYVESQLPKDIRALVRREFYDYAITCVNEMNDDTEIPGYVILLQDSSSIKTVSVRDGELHVTNEYIKSK